MGTKMDSFERELAELIEKYFNVRSIKNNSLTRSPSNLLARHLIECMEESVSVIKKKNKS